MDKPPRVIKLQNFSRLAEACASGSRAVNTRASHTGHRGRETVSCGFRQPNHKIDFLGHITARRALICDARVILAKRSSDLLHLTAREPRVSTLQSASRKSAAHAAAAMAAFNQNFQQPPQQQFQQQSSGFPHGGDYASGGSAVPTTAAAAVPATAEFQFNLGEDPTWGAQAQPTQYTSNGFNQPTPNGGAFYASCQGTSFGYDPSGIDEPPLLEELGVDFEDIWSKTKLVLTPSFRAVDERLVEGSDLAGPAVFALLLAGALVLRGKLHFGYVYGFGLSSCV